MISEWFLSLSASFVGWLAGLFPEWDPPSELTDAAGAVQGLLGGLSSLGVWVDWAVLSGCVVASLTAWGVVLVIKMIRAALSHVPAIGGSGD